MSYTKEKDYQKIKKEVINTTSSIISIFSVKDHLYTHHPSDEQMKDSINETINDLKEILKENF